MYDPNPQVLNMPSSNLKNCWSPFDQYTKPLLFAVQKGMILPWWVKRIAMNQIEPISLMEWQGHRALLNLIWTSGNKHFTIGILLSFSLLKWALPSRVHWKHVDSRFLFPFFVITSIHPICHPSCPSFCYHQHDLKGEGLIWYSTSVAHGRSQYEHISYDKQ